jgi:hypothetical protein
MQNSVGKAITEDKRIRFERRITEKQLGQGAGGATLDKFFE